MDICSSCGLPKDLCVCETISREKQVIRVKTEKKKFGKKYTIISGFEESRTNLEELVKKLKNKLACGGTIRDKTIELQGDHLNKIKKVLVEMGFSEEGIEIAKGFG